MNNKITKVTRKGILLDLARTNIFIEKNIIDFFKSDNLPSYDSRYKGLEGDYYQHRVNNPEDWPDDWYIEDDRLNFFGISDERFLSFLSYLIYPSNVLDYDEKYQEGLIIDLLSTFNNKLIQDGFEIIKTNKKISGKYVYEGKEILGGSKKVQFYAITNRYANTYNVYSEEGKILDEIPIESYEGKKKYPCIELTYNNWNDYGHRTSFQISFFLNPEHEINLGRIKILDKNNSRITIIPDTFSKLPSNFCSVFISDSCLQKIDSALHDYKRSIFLGLREIGYYENTEILNEFKNVEGFSYSLLRDSEVNARIRNLQKVISNFGISTFNGNVFFDFEKNILPHRINVLIGKNGCGKTTLLSNICSEIIEYDLIKRKDKKILNRTSFSQVMQISYSIFDDLYIPNTKSSRSKYLYCGIKSQGKDISILDIQEKLSRSLKVIQEKERSSIYSYLLNDILNSENIEFNIIEEEFNKCSSGQKILISILAQVVSNIEENSLLLFDEPETHLHPNMIFKLINVLHKLLDDNNSYLIIATHSPIVVQQIPARYVNILIEGGNRKLSETHECFGENFSEITKEIFGNYESEDVLYKQIFKELLKEEKNEGEILNLFNGKLSINASIYLKAIYNNKNKGETLKS